MNDKEELLASQANVVELNDVTDHACINLEDESIEVPDTHQEQVKDDKQEASTEDDQGKLNAIERKEQLVTTEEQLEKKSNFCGTSFNYINSILGVGIAGIPFALDEAGLATGVLLLIGMAALTDWSVGLLIRTSQICGAVSYPDLCYKAFGTVGRLTCAFFMWALTFFGCIGYTIVIGDTVPAVMEAILGFPDLATSNFWFHMLMNRTFWIVITTMLIILPLSLLDNISKLESFSFFSIIAEFILLGVVIAEAVIIFIRIGNGHPLENDITGFPTPVGILIRKNVFGAIGVFSMAYITHHNSHLLYDAMKNVTPKRFRNVTHVSMLMPATVMLLLGVFGYLAFQNNTKGNILNNLSAKSIQGNIARAAIAITMFFTFPLEMFVSRNAAFDIFTATIFRNFSLPISIWKFQIQKIYLIRLIVLILVSTIMFIAMIVHNLGSVLELTGSFSAVMLAYVLPSLCHLKIAEGRILSYKKLPALLLCIIGLICFFCGTGFNLYEAFARQGST